MTLTAFREKRGLTNTYGGVAFLGKRLGQVGISILMYNKTRTHFSSIIRIRPDQLAWLKENKDTRTVAGYLDKIINNHRDDLRTKERTLEED